MKNRVFFIKMTHFPFLYLLWASLVTQMVKNLLAEQETQVRSLGQENPLEKEMATHSSTLSWRIPCTEESGGLPFMESQTVGHNRANKCQASLVAQTVKHLTAMRETWVQSLGQENPLEKEMATHSSSLAWEIPWREEPGGLKRVGHAWMTDHQQHSCLKLQWAEKSRAKEAPWRETKVVVVLWPFEARMLCAVRAGGRNLWQLLWNQSERVTNQPSLQEFNP